MFKKYERPAKSSSSTMTSLSIFLCCDHFSSVSDINKRVINVFWNNSSKNKNNEKKGKTAWRRLKKDK